MSRPTVVLFDIDGTLITTGGVGRKALDLAFADLHGRAEACQAFSLDGMTDRAIVRLGLQAIGRPELEEAIDALLERYVDYLEQLVARAPDESYRVHDGMVAAIEATHAAGMAVGLGTGNIREGARVKLERVGLFRHFRFGGFGDEHEDRPTLIRHGAEAGAKLLGRQLSQTRVVVIGDTPKDVAAALAMGAECVGVGTGAYSAAQLLQAGATSAFDSLASPGALAAVLGPR